MRQRHLAALLSSVLLAGAASAQERLIWSDEFDSGDVPNPEVWSYDLGDNGWGNQELQNYTNDPANVRVRDGNLEITALGGGGEPFTSGRIKTEDKVIFTYATLEARIRVPDLADGLWPAFWTLGNNFSQIGWPRCGELDVFEMGNSAAITDGVINRRVASTAHWESDENYAGYGLSLDAAQDLNDEFQIFRMEWTPTLVTTYLNGEQIWAIDISPENCADCEEFHRPHFALLNMAVGGSYTGRLIEGAVTADTPATMFVDYVRIYDNGFTVVEGSGAEGVVPDIGPGHSGSWYNADQDGHGFSMEFGEAADGSPFAVIYWYTYDDQGNPVYLVGAGVPEDSSITVDFVSTSGMVFGEFDPSTVVRTPAGSGTFDFSDRDNAVFSYTPSDESAANLGHSPVTELPLTRLFAIPVGN
ncbi:MAG: glycoside hydrolase family 16 protein [Pseudomonadota bacterium]